MKINFPSKYFYKYLISGIFITSYSFIILSIFGEINFVLTLTFVELSSHLIRWLSFEKFVYSDLKFTKKRHSLIRYLYAIIVPYFLNIILYLFFPFNTVFLNSIRVIFTSAIVGFFWSEYIYRKK